MAERSAEGESDVGDLDGCISDLKDDLMEGYDSLLGLGLDEVRLMGRRCRALWERRQVLRSDMVPQIVHALHQGDLSEACHHLDTLAAEVEAGPRLRPTPRHPLCVWIQAFDCRGNLQGQCEEKHEVLPTYFALCRQVERNMRPDVSKMAFTLELDQLELGNTNTSKELAKLQEHGANECVVKLQLPAAWKCHRRVLIYVEGIIGSGKTTLLDHLQKESEMPGGLCVEREPIAMWERTLVEFYDQLKRDRSAFSTDAKGADKAKTRAATHEVAERLERMVWRHHAAIAQNSHRRPTIAERSPLSTIRVFCQMLEDQGLLEARVREDLERSYRAFSHEPCVVLYCDINVASACKRIDTRAEKERPYEKGMGEDYLRALEEKYHEVFPRTQENVIVINTDDDDPMGYKISLATQQIVDILKNQGCDGKEIEVVRQFLKRKS